MEPRNDWEKEFEQTVCPVSSFLCRLQNSHEQFQLMNSEKLLKRFYFSTEWNWQETNSQSRAYGTKVAFLLLLSYLFPYILEKFIRFILSFCRIKKIFLPPKGLAMHVRSVEKLRPDILKRHEKTHINEKQHQCDIIMRQVIPSQFVSETPRGTSPRETSGSARIPVFYVL